MASNVSRINTNIMELSRNVTIQVKFSKMREWTLRVKLGTLLLRFALWVMPFDTEIETDA